MFRVSPRPFCVGRSASSDSVKCQLAVADVAVVLRAFLICEETEGETFDIGEKVYFVTDEVVVYEVVTRCAEDQHVLRDMSP